MSEREPDFNERMGEIWASIEGSIDIEGKRCIDLGCGYGELAYRLHLAGAEYVLGIDRDLQLIHGQPEKWKGVVTGLAFEQANINKFTLGNKSFRPPYDVAFCFSVLPYLAKWRLTLYWMQNQFHTSVIECQYWGDGPGLAELRDDQDMRIILEQTGWKNVEVIGGSIVKKRGTVRTIWRCVNA